MSVFVGSRACAANHYVVVEKCGYSCMSTSSANVDLANRWRSGVRYSFRKIVVTHTERSTFRVYNKRASRRLFERNFHI